MNYQETLDYLYSRLPMYQRVGQTAFKKDLTNTIALCKRLGDPQYLFKSIHVAGTNGKGSVSHGLASVLQEAGYKTGLYTSPHLKDFTERIRINGVPVAAQQVVDFVSMHQQDIEDIQPSFFELTVAMAFDYFAQEQVDIAVIEVGLGGRLDSTNVLKPLISVITNISFDHQDMLGDTLPAIAMEKAGIIKSQVPVVIGVFQSEVEQVFREKADACQAQIYFADQLFRLERQPTHNPGLAFKIHSSESWHPDQLEIDLAGSYQMQNVPAMLQTIKILQQLGFNLPDESIRKGLANIRSNTGLKGRWQILQKKPLMLCDTGHNEAGIAFVMDQLQKINKGNLHLIIGMVKDKDLSRILALLPQKATYYFCQASIPRALPAVQLSERAGEFGLRGYVIENVNEAIKAANQVAGSNDLIFIGGSSFVVAEIDSL